MKKKLDKSPDEVWASELYLGESSYEIVDKENRISKKNDKLYIGEMLLSYTGQPSVYKVAMVPKEIYDDIEAYLEAVSRVEYAPSFPYIELAINKQITGDAYVDIETGDIVSDSSPVFGEIVTFKDTIEEGYTDITEKVHQKLQQAQKIDPAFTVVFRILPFSDSYIDVRGDEIIYGFHCITQLAIVKNPVITNKKEDSKC